MTFNSKIEWTDHTFNPWIGCTKVSAGCKNCYAENMMAKRYKRVEWGPQGERVRTSDANWRKPISWNKQAEALGVRYRVFCSSLADVFEIKDDQPEMDDWRFDLLTLISRTPNLDWLLLTKRPENVLPIIEGHLAFMNGVANASEIFNDLLPNVWIGISVENQEQADKRIPELLQIPAKVRFLSMEPLLGPVSLRGLVDGIYRPWLDHFAWKVEIDWIIVGGESGPGKRPMNPDWARSIRDQCKMADVPFFMKQMDKVEPIPEDLMIREFPKVAGLTGVF